MSYIKNSFTDEKYRQKYPEFFSDDFENFCKTQVIPLYKSTKQKIMGKGLLNFESKMFFLSLFSVLFAILLFFGIVACFESDIPSIITKFMSPVMQNIFSNRIILVSLIFAFFAINIIFYCIKICLKTKEKTGQIKIITVNAFSLLILTVFLFSIHMFKEIPTQNIFTVTLLISIFLLLVGKLTQIMNKIKKEYKTKNLHVKKVVFSVLLSKIAKCTYLTPEHKDYNIQPYLEKLFIIDKCYGGIIEAADDHFRLIYNDTPVEIIEILLPRTAATEIYINSRKKTIHEGYGGNCLFMRVKSNKPFIGKTLITRECNINVLNSAFKKIQTEDAEFNRIFSVESTNQVEARYLLTPTFMERIKEFAKDFPKNELNVSFEHGFVNIILSKGDYDSFEIGSFDFELTTIKTDPFSYITSAERGDKINTYRDILIELKESLTVIDALKLDSTIGL